jgi:pimeloyl-ACP methyl ester carboxylesterase
VPSTTELEIVEAGAAGPLVVFVHGAMDRGRSFDAVADLLAPECRTIRYDRRGYGAPATEPLGVLGHADDLLAVIGDRRALVVAHSFGGITALAAAVRDPGAVAAIVLYETPVAWAPGWDDHVMVDVMRSDDPLDAGLRVIFGPDHDDVSGERLARRRTLAATFIAEERSVRGASPPFALADVRVPVLYGRGAEESMAAVVQHLDRELPELELAVIPGAGHHAHRTAPDAFADLARRGLQLASVD